MAKKLRIAITGGSGTGKTTLSEQYESVFHCDVTIPMGWSEASQHIADTFDTSRFECFEGVQIPRAARKWLAQHPTGRPFDTLIVLTQPHRRQTPGQLNQANALYTVLDEIIPELQARGVVVIYRP